MKRWTSSFAVFAVAASWAAAKPIDVDNPPAGKFSDEWYVVTLDGHKSGHMHSTMTRVKRGGRDLIESRTEMHLEMRRAGNTVGITVLQSSDETIDGKPVAFAKRMKLGKLPDLKSTEGKIVDGIMTVTSRQMATEPLVSKHPLPEGAKMAWAAYREQIKRGLKPGTTYEIRMLEPMTSLTEPALVRVEVQGREMIDLFGRKGEAVRAKQTVRITNAQGQATTMDTTTWMTDAGTAVRMSMSMMRMPIEMRACSKSVALAANDPAELMTQTFIKPKGEVDRRAGRITYRLSVKDKTAHVDLSSLPTTGVQTVKPAADKKSVLITLTRPSARKEEPKGEPLSPADRKRYLAVSTTLNFDDPVVARLARKAARGEKNPEKLAARLCRFVDDYVATKDFSVGFATASEVARSKEGDCSEHGVLLAALGRAHAIPSRMVTGLLYTDTFASAGPIFAGHLWTQFWIDGRWVDVDATRPDVEVGPTHIALSTSDGGETALGDLVNSIWLHLTDITIEVVRSSK